MGDWSATRWPLRAAVIAALASAALLIQRAAIAGNRLAAGSQGALFARFDLGVPLLIAMVAFVSARRSLEGRTTGGFGLRWIPATYIAWALTVAFAKAALHLQASPRRLLTTLVFFRGTGSPLPGLGAGPLLLTLALTVVVMPALVELSRRTVREQQWMVPVALGLIALAYRAVCTASGHTGLFGPLSWLPNHLDLVGVGLAVALVDASLGEASARRRMRLGGIVVAGVSFILAVFALGLPKSPLIESATDVHVYALVALTFAAGLLCATCVVPPTLVRRGAPRLAKVVAITAPGLLLAGEPAFTLVARQYHERVFEFEGGVFLHGNVVAPFIWSLVIASAFSVVIVAAVGAIDLVRHGEWRALVSSRLALPAVVAMGFFVRLVALLTVLPERTDNGDPLFYHTTANVLARGRGFLEPLRWRDFETYRPSAFHGPLYPVVLSITSRFGGTSYFDHKMMSILIGTAVVLAAGVLGKRLGGNVVGLGAAAFAAVYPNLWQIDGLLYPEGLMALLVTVTMILAYRWRDRPSLATAALFGATIALAALARGEGILLLPLLAVPWIMLSRALSRAVRVRHLVVTVVACGAVLAPWMIRNATTFENFVPLSTNGNEVMVYANCASVYNGPFVGYWDFQCQETVRQATGEPPGDESQVALYWRSLGFDYARDHVGELPRVVTLRVLRQWELFRPLQNVNLGGIEGRNRDASTMGLMMYYGLAGLSIVGAVSMRRRRIPLLPIGVQFLSVTITSAYTYGSVRFRAPAEPALCVLGAVGLVPVVALARRWLARESGASEGDGDVPSAGAPFVLGGSGGLRPRLSGAWNRGALATWTAIGSVCALIALPLRGLYHTTGGTMEEAFMMVFPERMLKGDLPNRDFLHLYGPGALQVLAGWYKVVGVSLESERTFGLIQHLGIICALFTLARPWGRIAAAAVAGLAVFYVLTPIGLTAMAWNGGLALCLWSIVFALRARTVANPRRSLIAAGVLAGLALTYRPDLALALIIVYSWYLWRNPHRRTVVIAAFVGLVPMWVHVALVGPSTAFRGMVIDPVFKLRAGRELPRPPSWSHLDGSLQAIAELIPPWWKLPALSAPKSLFLWFFAMLIVPLFLVWIAVRLWRQSHSARAATLLCGALFSVGVAPQALQRPDSTHLSWVTCISFPLLILAVVEYVRERRPRSTQRQRVTAGIAAAVALTFVVAPLFTFRYYLLHTRVSAGDVQTPFPVTRNGRRFYLGDFGPYLASRDVIADLDKMSKPGERLLVGPSDLRRTWYSDAFFYYMFPELTPATYFIEMDP
ncbi:MAG: glycosyltransferase family 39 protein, partial [Ilumatobacteraceae bacterium]|nr:glycosyltransferase family 39 protein [Ilumatobacteraceae bacterium]